MNGLARPVCTLQYLEPLPGVFGQPREGNNKQLQFNSPNTYTYMVAQGCQIILANKNK